jgi:hypothetical protein
MVIHPFGVIFLPVADYLYERVVFQNASHGTVLGEAYILCAWLNYLHEHGHSWKDATDDLIKSHAQILSSKSVKEPRIQLCADRIFQFYWYAEFRLGLVKNLLGENPADARGPIYPVTVLRGKDGKAVGRFQYTTLEDSPGRPTPEPFQVDQILDRLLSRQDSERASCFWLSANLMYRSGLREQGVEGLTLTAVASALKAEGIHVEGRPYDLYAASHDAEVQAKIFASLGDLGLKGRSKLFIRVTEKGRPPRDAGVPLDLLEHLLFYIWTARAELVARLFSRRRNYRRCDSLFLSLKSGMGLHKKSIGNLINATFKNLHIPGSAHRLRAAFAEDVVREAYLRARAANGDAWDRNAVLLEAAEALGHKNTKSLGHYLNRIIRELELIQGKIVVVTEPAYYDDVQVMVDLLNAGNDRIATEVRKLVAAYRETSLRTSRDRANFSKRGYHR